MSEENVTELSDAELVEMAGSRVIGTQSGMKAQAAQTEMTRRLILALRDSKESADGYSKLLIYFTVLLFVIGLAQLILFSLTLPDIPVWARISGTILIAVCIVGFAFYVSREIHSD